EAVQVGQSEIQDDKRDVRLDRPLERFLPAAHPFNVIAVRLEPLVQERGDARLVLHHEQLHRGIRIQNVAPRPGRLTTPHSPPGPRATPRTIHTPSPAPLSLAPPVLNGSNTACSSPGGSPPPSSATSKRQFACSA